MTMLGLSGRLWKTSGSSALALDSFPWPLRVQRLADWRNPVRRGVPTPKENGDPYGVAVTAIAEVSRLKVAAGRGGGGQKDGRPERDGGRTGPSLSLMAGLSQPR